MTEHTPGPWKIDNELAEKGIGEVWALHNDPVYGVTICQPGNVYESNDFPEMTDEMWANARLIAAAPELLELLIELTDIEGPQPGHVEWYRKVQAAIAKATGEGS